MLERSVCTGMVGDKENPSPIESCFGSRAGRINSATDYVKIRVSMEVQIENERKFSSRTTQGAS